MLELMKELARYCLDLPELVPLFDEDLDVDLALLLDDFKDGADDLLELLSSLSPDDDERLEDEDEEFFEEVRFDVGGCCDLLCDW